MNKEFEQQLKDIEENLDYLLESYDSAMYDMVNAKTVEDEQEHEEALNKIINCIDHEMKKLRTLGMAGEEIQINTSENATFH